MRARSARHQAATRDPPTFTQARAQKTRDAANHGAQDAVLGGTMSLPRSRGRPCSSDGCSAAPVPSSSTQATEQSIRKTGVQKNKNSSPECTRNAQQCWLDWPRWGVCWCRAGTRFASKSQALCAAGALWRLTLPAVALCTLSARRCVPREADDPGCSGTAIVQDSQHVPLRCGARRVQRSPRTRRAVRACCTMVQTCCDR